MIREVKTFEFTCDDCGLIEIVHSHWETLPDGWARVPDYDCGLTGYTRSDEVCGPCAATRAAAGQAGMASRATRKA